MAAKIRANKQHRLQQATMKEQTQQEALWEQFGTKPFSEQD